MTVRDSLHISWQNDISKFTLAADVDTEPGYPLEKMQNQVANEPTVFDMSSDSTIVITGSVSDALIASCFSIHNHNATDDAEVRLRLYADEDQTGDVMLDSDDKQLNDVIPIGALFAGLDEFGGTIEGSGSAAKKNFSLWFPTVQYKSFQIDITAPTTNDDEFAIDKLWLGPAFCPQYGPNWGFECGFAEDSEHQRKPGGGMETVEHAIYRKLNVEFQGQENHERKVMSRMMAIYRKGADMLVTIDPNDTINWRYESTSIYRRTSSNSFRAQHFNFNNSGLALEEN